MEVQEIKSEFNGSGEKAPLTLDRALKIFDSLADMEDIAFAFLEDGCYARAHIMCRRLDAMGLKPQKVWAFEGKKLLEFISPEGKKVPWHYHVAPVLCVQMQDGIVRDMVFDPALFDGPVTPAEWGDIISASPKKIQVVPFGVAPKGCPYDYRPSRMSSASRGADKDADNVMKDHLWLLDKKACRIVFPSPYREQVLSAQNIQGRMEGKTWISAKVAPAERLAPSYLEAKP